MVIIDFLYLAPSDLDILDLNITVLFRPDRTPIVSIKVEVTIILHYIVYNNKCVAFYTAVRNNL